MRPRIASDFETLVELYYQPVFTFAIRLSGRFERALELTQHTFCRALERQAYLGEGQSARRWLFTLLLREFLKEKRDERKQKSSFAVGPQAHRSKSGLAAPILAALTKVREELRRPLVLFYARDLSFSQIADYLGISMEAVLTLLSKGREELSLAMTASSLGRTRLPDIVSLGA